MSRAIGRIGVLMGGPSSEREISLKSGGAVYLALKELGLDVIPLDININSLNKIKKSKIEVAFIALHGKFGEDGSVQRFLESWRIPYTGSGVIASYLCLDKVASRRIFQHYGITVPSYEILCHKNCLPKLKFGFPVVVKPSNQGSSIGISFVDNERKLSAALNLAFKYDQTAIIEEYIPGREITVGILEEKPLAVVEITPKSRFFDFQAKYEKGASDYTVPAQLPSGQYQRAQKIAVLAHQCLGCRMFSRVDMILSKSGPVVLEVNSIPGFTSTSLLPMAAEACGVSFAQLCLRLVQTAAGLR